MMHIGVWEESAFVGCILFARGANRNLFGPYGLTQIEGCELVRIALAKHKTPVSRLVRISLQLLKRQCQGIRLVVSFADPAVNHHGGVYQAGGWIYAGRSADSFSYRDNQGKIWHPRMISSTGIKKVFGSYRKVLRPEDCVKISMPGKHRYLMPLDDEMRARIAPLARPYPKRAGSADSGTTDFQSGGGGATPTPALSQNHGADDAAV
jgi:hypothetical protein